MNTIAKQATGVFQSTPSRRGRHQRIPPRGQTRGFQSTPSRRGRRADEVHNFLSYSFNPLPHAEGDNILSLHFLLHSRFNPLPHAEGDFHPLVLLFYNFVSIHSLTQRETILALSAIPAAEFQSTPSRRGRPYHPQLRLPNLCFNPLPHAEGDRRMLP